jgi:Cu(I)/Ag(I) efflux system membrane protein CusA/SilA
VVTEAASKWGRRCSSPAHHHLVVHSGVHAGGSGGSAVWPLGLHQNLRHGGLRGLAVTLVPVLMGYLIRGRIPDEKSNPVNSVADCPLPPVLELVLRVSEGYDWGCRWSHWRAHWIPLSQLGGEFMPPLDEGDLLYMPSALPGCPQAKASELLQQTDRTDSTVPEVEACSARPGAPRRPPTRRRWRCSRPPSSSSHANNGAPA